MRVCLFTDTLADVNGVSRFIANIAAEARATGRDLTVLTSTRLPLEPATNIANFPPLYARRMPKYENLELAFPPARAMLRHARALGPDAIHASTPGPVGLAGLLAAWKLGVPLLGVYHTDFPAYIEHLFRKPFLTRATAGYMRLFYSRFVTVFTRTEEYAAALVALGIARERIVRLLPGIDVSKFQPSLRDPGLWARLGIRRDGPKVLSIGRVSVEKNLPLLARAWRQVVRESGGAAGAASGPGGGSPTLVVVGDGPYRAAMERELGGYQASFLGFRHGAELSALYASADLFVFPSATDTLGQVVMEAQSSGLPVLVSDQGGPREVVREGETGLVLPAGDPSAWAAAIVSLVADPSRRARMGAAAHTFMQSMTIRHSFEHFWSVHEEAVRARAGPKEQTPGRPGV
ncbi:MAG: glycosyltransferase family 1 protein [Phycisphaerales bacterium]